MDPLLQKVVAVYTSWRDYQIITVGLLHQHTGIPPTLSYFQNFGFLILYYWMVCVMTTCMLSGVFHMLSALCIWFVLFDLRYLVLRVHDDGLCLICLVPRGEYPEISRTLLDVFD